MSKFLETYGVAIFTLVLMAILIAFAGPLGLKIKEYTLEKAEQTEQIGKDAITVATGGTVRPEEPTEAVDKIYCIYYDDGEMTISQNEIEPEVGRTVVKKGFYTYPYYCTTEMTIVKFVGAVKPKSCQYWFVDCSSLTEIKNIENLYTNECTNMGYMFKQCNSLTNIDLSGFDTSNVTNMNYMFYNCESFTSLDLSNFDTSNVTNMDYMFYCCKNLTSLDVSKFDTSKVISMYEMFSGCNSLISLDLSNFNTSKVTWMYKMFYNCISLTNLSIKNFKFEKVRAEEMFYNCTSLISLDFSNGYIDKNTSATSMFMNCSSLLNKSIKISKIAYDNFPETWDRIPRDTFDIVN